MKTAIPSHENKTKTKSVEERSAFLLAGLELCVVAGEEVDVLVPVPELVPVVVLELNGVCCKEAVAIPAPVVALVLVAVPEPPELTLLPEVAFVHT